MTHTAPDTTTPDVKPAASAGRVASPDIDVLRSIGTDLASGVPDGDPATAWQRRRDAYKLVGPLNRRKFTVIVVGTGLAGAGCAAALGELGYNVSSYTFHDAPRRAHSVAAQGGINAARARKVDNDSLHRFVVDTVKGGDFRGREADAFRLAEESVRAVSYTHLTLPTIYSV